MLGNIDQEPVSYSNTAQTVETEKISQSCIPRGLPVDHLR